MLNQTKIFIGIISILIGIAFIGTVFFDGMILQSIGAPVQLGLGLIFVGVGILIFFEARSRSLKK